MWKRPHSILMVANIPDINTKGEVTSPSPQDFHIVTYSHLVGTEDKGITANYLSVRDSILDEMPSIMTFSGEAVLPQDDPSTLDFTSTHHKGTYRGNSVRCSEILRGTYFMTIVPI
jgi:hypothetical protein